MTRVSISRTNSSASFKQPDQPYNVHDAALLGALSAFVKQPSTPKSHLKTYGGSNGAPTAAADAGNKRLSSSSRMSNDLTPVAYQGTGSSNVTGISIRSAGMKNLEVPLSLDRTANRPRSSSDIAAELAAAKDTTVMSSPRSGGPPKAPHDALPASGTVQSAKARFGVLSSGSDEHGIRTSAAMNDNQRQDAERPDSTSIAPTTSLVRLFEQNAGGGPPEGSIRKAQGRPSPNKSKKPQIVLSRAATSDIVDLSKQRTTVEDTTPQRTVETKAPPSAKVLSTSKTYGGTSQDENKRSSRFARADADGSTSADYPRPNSQETVPAVNEPDSPTAKLTENVLKHKPQPNLPPPRRAGKTSTQGKPPSDSELQPTKGPSRKTTINDTSTKLLPSKRLPSPPEPSKRSTLPIANPYQHQSLRQLQPHMTGDALANAIVGAHLATSRAPSPSRSPAPPLPQRQHHHHHHHHPFHHSRTPSPSKLKPGTLRQTMRKEPSSSDSSSDSGRYRGRKHLVRKHPHKHREGDRKRWRDVITERERKRYEGVWAANRGLHLGPLPHYHDEVLNLVVRDIWARSRLPGHVLEEVWDLVDSRCVGRLLREEFVVGLWLVDQRLKGRKLPVRVSESVWGSVRWAGGITLRRRIG